MEISPSLVLIVYSRSYCHLCGDMIAALEQLRACFAFEIEIIDVDASPVLLSIYDELVPVLVARTADGGGTQLCHYVLDVDRVTTFLTGQTTKREAMRA